MPAEFLRKLDEIEAEMRRIGYWSESPEVLAAVREGRFRSFLDAPSFQLWLQGLFLPNARAAAHDDELPAHSQAGEIARRQYGAYAAKPEARRLLELIHEFDRLCLQRSAAPARAGENAAARIVEILIAASPSSPVVAKEQVRAIAGRGLEGDRYANGNGTFSAHPQKPDGELTLVQQEHIDAFVAASGIRFTAHDARRNLVTTGIDLNALVGREFRVGAVRIRGLRLCEPCNYLAKQTSPEVLPGLVHKGGLRAQILSDGVIAVGDAVEVERPPPLSP